MAESKATVLARFCVDVRTLLLTHGMVESELHKEMRQLVLRASEGQPTVSVLFNACYGGYEYSPAFEEFKLLSSSQTSSLAALCIASRVRKGSECHRVTDALLMAPFGQQVASEWPQVGTMVKVYEKHHLGTAYERLNYMANSMGPAISRLEEKIAVFAGVAGRGIISDWAPFEDKLQYEAAPALKAALQQQQQGEAPWSSAALKEMVASLRLALLKQREDEAGYRGMLDASFGAAYVDAMLASLHHSFPQEAAEAKLPAYKRTKWSENGKGNTLTLLEALTLSGEGSFRVWHCQVGFVASAMRHLLRCPHHVTHLLATDRIPIPRKQWELERGWGPEATVAWDEKLGLVAASGTYSRLAIAHVPQLAEWKIKEYDGTEGVVF